MTRDLIGDGGALSLRGLVLLERYPLPGKTRELENAIERAIVLGMTEQIQPEEAAPGAMPLGEYHAEVNEARLQIILRALEKSKGNMARAARTLGIQATCLQRLIRNLELRSQLKHPPADDRDYLKEYDRILFCILC